MAMEITNNYSNMQPAHAAKEVSAYLNRTCACLTPARNGTGQQTGKAAEQTDGSGHLGRNGSQKKGNAFISQFTDPREEIMHKIRQTSLQSAAAFSDTRAGILQEVREEKGQYGYSDVVNACGFCYAKLYSEIEQRHAGQQEQYCKADGTPLTKEEEIEWLDLEYEQEVAWQKSCARIAAQGQVFQKHMSQIPANELEELEDCFYQAKAAYMKLYQESRQAGSPLTLQTLRFGRSQMYQRLDSILV